MQWISLSTGFLLKIKISLRKQKAYQQVMLLYAIIRINTWKFYLNIYKISSNVLVLQKVQTMGHYSVVFSRI